VSIASFASAAGQGGPESAAAFAPLVGAGASNAASLARGPSSNAAFADFGLSARFTVRFINSNGIDSLGEWSSCQGLGMSFQTDRIKDGGGQQFRPTQVTYPTVTLERAMQRDTSKMLQTWLGKLVHAWNEDVVQPMGTVDITLYDVNAQEVATWSLLNAFPVGWSGPALNARQDAVALETLTLKHEGFLPQSMDRMSTPAAGTQSGPVPGQQTQQSDPTRAKLGPAQSDGFITFDFNPATVVLSHTAPVTASAGLRQGQAGGGAPQAQSAGSMELPAVEQLQRAKSTTSITLRSLTFEDSAGASLMDTCRRLLYWSEFQAVTDAKSAKRAELTRLNFIWGPHVYLVHLTQVNVAYTRFSREGQPLRAAVDLTLHTVPKVLNPTNPSSGGLPGRRSHLLVGAQTLPALATSTYGGPGRWREIAAANGFEDPLRVRPGTLVYLPGAQETEQ
jgi:phage tail-like protein